MASEATAPKLGRDVSLVASVEKYEVVQGSGARDTSALGKGLDILKARISLASSGQHVEFTIRVVYGGNNMWRLRKRFSEVVALHDVLKVRLTSVPEVPSKSAVRQFSHEYLEARKDSLNNYLRELCRRRDAMNCSEVWQFFALPQNVPTFRQIAATDPIQAAEVQEAIFGVVDFVYDSAQGWLLLGATDVSWTSRIDTKITNIKLPWEPNAPNLPTSQMSLWVQSPADLRFEVAFASRYVPEITCCAILSAGGDKGLCLCGLANGTVGMHHIGGEPGVNSAGATLPLLRHTAGIVAMAVDDAEQWVFTASKDTSLKVYDTRRQMIQSEVQTPAPVVTMKHVAQQKRLITGLATGRAVIWDTSILPIQQLATIPAEAMDPSVGKMSALDFDVSTGTLFAATKELVGIFTVKSANSGVWGRKIGQIGPINSQPTAMAWAQSSRELLIGFSSGAVVVYDIDSGEASFAIQAHREEVTRIEWLDAPRRLLTASKDKTLKIWDFPRLGQPEAEVQEPTAPVVSVAPSMGTTRMVRGLASAPPAGGGGPAPAPAQRSGGYAAAAPTGPLGGQPWPAACAAPALPREPLAGGRAAQPPAAAQQPVAISRPQREVAPSAALGKDDSDDDLVGWDS